MGLRPAALPSGSTLRLQAARRSFSPALIGDFTRATGLGVEVSFLDDPGAALAPDVAIIPAYSLTGLIRERAVRELGPLSPPGALEQRAYDPLNAFSLPAARGAVGVNARWDAPPTSWADFFERARAVPAHLPPAESFGAALRSLGHSINTRDAAARSRARALLGGLTSAPLLEARLALGAPIPGWNFAVPAEGAERWEDCFCIPAGSPQPDLARSFIRFALLHPPRPSLPDVPLEPRSPFAPPPA